MEQSSVDGTQRHRVSSLDLLKIISMLMIILFHLLGHGEVLDIVQSSGINVRSVLFQFVYSLCSVGVNCFVLISGYFLSNKTFKTTRLLSLWFSVEFYSVAIYVLLRAINAISTTGGIELFKAILPVSFRQYWFVSCYFCMALLSPVLNKLIRALTKEQFKKVLILMIVLFSLWNTVIFPTDTFGTAYGYHFVWFAVLYLIGAYIREYIDLSHVKQKKCLSFYVVICVLMTVSWAMLELTKSVLPGLSDSISSEYFVNYSSLFSIAASLALFIAFLKMRCSWCGEFVSKVSSLTFGVYLIHDNHYMRSIMWDEVRDIFNLSQTQYLLLKCIGIVVLIFTMCILIDLCRSLLFTGFGRMFQHIKGKKKRKIEKCVTNKIDKFMNAIQD